MTTTTSDPTTDEPVRFNPFAPGFVEDPYAQYARLRDDDPVHRSGLLHGWVVTRFDDVGKLLRDPSISSDVRKATPTPVTEIELSHLEGRSRGQQTVVLLDDPDHARVRKLMADPFKPRQIEALRQMIVDRVHEALDRLHDAHAGGSSRAEIDLIADFAYPLPVEIISEMLGIPGEDHPQFRYWTQCVARAVDPILSPDEQAECLAGLDEMYSYLEAVADEKRAHPDDGLVSTLVHAIEDGEVLTRDEVMSQLVTLYMAGHEPTASLIGAGMYALVRQPDQLARLRADRGQLRNAVSELLRFDGPNQFVRRITTQPTTVGDVELPAGEVIFASPASANRDPRRWGEDADRVVIDRTDAGQHLQFGAGPHACLGSHLARMQAEIAFDALLDRVHDIELAGEARWNTRMFIRGMDALPLTCTISAR
ncbi:MAG: cytochrome P450 [Acidimicrobiales bacterium]